MIASTEQQVVIAATPTRLHITTRAIVPRAKIDTLRFPANTSRIRTRMELFEKASAIKSKIRLV
jgi:hypothetical protein